MTTILQEAHQKAKEAAAEAAQDFLDVNLDGKDNYPCGFAWVTFTPQNKGNTRDGKDERRMFEALGYRKDYTGKSWTLWNPSDNHCQNVDAKYAGARAYADTFLAETGIKVYASERLD